MSYVTNSVPGFINGLPVACCDIMNSFDGSCYLARYPDVAADGKYNTPAKAYAHWLNYGKFEGRIPGCDPTLPGCNCNTDINYEGDPPTTTPPIVPPIPGTGVPDKNKTILILAAAAVAAYFLFRKKK